MQRCCSLEVLTPKLQLHHAHLWRLLISEKSSQGKLYCWGKANQPLDRVNASTVLCSELAYNPLKSTIPRGLEVFFSYATQSPLFCTPLVSRKPPHDHISLIIKHQYLLQEELTSVLSGYKFDFNINIHFQTAAQILQERISEILATLLRPVSDVQAAHCKWKVGPTFWPTHQLFFLEAKKEHHLLLFTCHRY